MVEPSRLHGNRERAVREGESDSGRRRYDAQRRTNANLTEAYDAGQSKSFEGDYQTRAAEFLENETLRYLLPIVIVDPRLFLPAYGFQENKGVL